jgi:hypothetical protein
MNFFDRLLFTGGCTCAAEADHLARARLAAPT